MSEIFQIIHLRLYCNKPPVMRIQFQNTIKCNNMCIISNEMIDTCTYLHCDKSPLYYQDLILYFPIRYRTTKTMDNFNN